jgi:histone H2A
MYSLIIVYLAAVLEYITTELVEISGDQAKQCHHKKKKILPRNIKLAVANDDE